LSSLHKIAALEPTAPNPPSDDKVSSRVATTPIGTFAYLSMRATCRPRSASAKRQETSVWREAADVKPFWGAAASPPISDVNLLGYGKCVVYLDAEVPDGALDLRVTEQELDRSEIAGPTIIRVAFCDAGVRATRACPGCLGVTNVARRYQSAARPHEYQAFRTVRSPDHRRSRPGRRLPRLRALQQSRAGGR
jgi:hypothetical protein